MHELLTPREMGEADRLAIAAGPYDGYALMRNAGVSIVGALLERFPDAGRIAVLCGPGNNGGDGYVAAKLLSETGLAVACFRNHAPRENSAAFLAAADYEGPVHSLEDFAASEFDLIIDAFYGAGLARSIEGIERSIIDAVNAANVPVVSVDLPSGISGASGATLGAAFKAILTVTFFRKKPGHVLQPGRDRCGEILVTDIGIGERVLDAIAPQCFENTPHLWHQAFPTLSADIHKYRRGHAVIFSGGLTATGATRLSARAAARIGAGAVTVLSPPDALLVHAAHLTSIMLRRTEAVADAVNFIRERKVFSAVLGPGFGDFARIRELVPALLDKCETGEAFKGLVLDADALTAFEDDPDQLFRAAGETDANALVLTPHEGEFHRLFGTIGADQALSKLEKARHASKRANAIIIYKGPDTVIAAPDGRAAINTNATPLLATAGSGDVLAGMVSGMLAQRMPTFEAAAAAVWLHADAAKRFGPGLIAEDLPEMLPEVLADLGLG
ncbi:bifunctional ADP-dependent NAD(P)H-hydrate dehydratase/NAD(P)H-hydrate epimerase [Phyllobacterium phragmitis]|uniref:Bifunctional NAD(P)H-hydrate repair enzyme n=1 Tax=Phyllobacterium phragmitis TaxID=2670329 RepID=A0A2S9ILD4_9HYPH|nr:NAD(P)H-hydrate dehydratase [Phyllobacterium phragmitis]PRD41346.1 bifunctional ADP-dependent NAD(P)H-hydrate dehydratase/NAD(P)H-hydrate epimerase [Phyllobacterium phragmitis]